MSYEIDVASVRAVLLADGWHRVKGRSFGIEPYGFVAGLPDGGLSDDKDARDADAKAAGKGNGKSAKGARKKAAALTPPHVAEKGLTPTMGARWTKPNGEVIACPVGSVLALRQARRRAVKA